MTTVTINIEVVDKDALIERLAEGKGTKELRRLRKMNDSDLVLEYIVPIIASEIDYDAVELKIDSASAKDSEKESSDFGGQ